MTGLDFGDFQNITVSGQAYNDLNGNGTEDPGEPGLQGWTLDLFDAFGNFIATTTTNANGDYSFTDVGPGTYTVPEVLMSGWTQTQPVNPGHYSFTTQSGLNETGLNFGNSQMITVSGVVLQRHQWLGHPLAARSQPGELDHRPGGYVRQRARQRP